MRLRDSQVRVLRREDAFRDELRAEIALHDPAWENRVAEGPRPSGAPPPVPAVQRTGCCGRPRAYRVVADALKQPARPRSTKEFLAACQALGQQYVLQRRIVSPESVSQVLFATGLRLARNRGLTAPDAPDLSERRHAFAEETRQVIRRVDAVDALVAARHAGLL
jgi:glycerol-3-phosphate O-acyltransferase